MDMNTLIKTPALKTHLEKMAAAAIKEAQTGSGVPIEQALEIMRDALADTMVTCGACQKTFDQSELEKSMGACPHCGVPLDQDGKPL